MHAMLTLIQLVVLIGCLKLLVDTERPAMCAGILAGSGGVLSLIGGNPVLVVVIATALSFAYCFGWFWVLVRVGGGLLWWLVLAAGLLVPVIFRLLLSTVAAE
jgi:hypothetical protein